LTLGFYGPNPLVFVLVSALFFGVFGEIYSLFPATSGDTFGSKFATTNNGMLYTAKGTAALYVPLAGYLASIYGWTTVFGISVVANVIAACLALFVLKPMRRRLMQRALTEGDAGAPARAALAS
jgi:OFA family oxalate/formate antiporter-like MFS transporter